MRIADEVREASRSKIQAGFIGRKLYVEKVGEFWIKDWHTASSFKSIGLATMQRLNCSRTRGLAQRQEATALVQEKDDSGFHWSVQVGWVESESC